MKRSARRYLALFLLILGTLTQVQARDYSLARSFPNPTPATGDFFGETVASGPDGGILIGDPTDDTGAADAGAVYLFDSATSSLLRTFANPTPSLNDNFGFGLASFGDYLVVGAPSDDTAADNAGAVYVFDGRTGGILQTFLNPNPGSFPTPASLDEFGSPVAAGDDLVVVGARDEDLIEESAGAVYIFDVTTGSLLRTLLSPTPTRVGNFGFSLSVAGGRVLVGAPGEGAVYLFDSVTGDLLQSFFNPSADESNAFGRAVFLSGDRAIVGAPEDDTVAPFAGAAYVFDATTGDLLWAFLNPNPETCDEFGRSLAGVGHVVAIGDNTCRFGASSAGAVYIFDLVTGSLLQTLLHPNPTSNAQFGRSIASVASDLLVGAPHTENTGAAYLFVRNNVTIDIKPGGFPNSINPNSKGKIPMAILTTDATDNTNIFDATTVDPITVRFGSTGTEAAPVKHALEDVDGDGDTDVILHFNTQDTGIQCGDTSATLTGGTFGGQAIQGTDSIKTLGCK